MKVNLYDESILGTWSIANTMTVYIGIKCVEQHNENNPDDRCKYSLKVAEE